MPRENQLSIRVLARSGEIGEDSLKVLTWTPAERKQRAIKAGLIGLGAAIVSLFIPIVHFFMVPLALLGSPILIWFILRQESYAPKQSISCPHCSQKIEMAALYTLSSTEILCDACRQVLRIEFKP